VFINQAKFVPRAAAFSSKENLFEIPRGHDRKAKRIKLGAPLERETEDGPRSSAKSNTNASAPTSNSVSKRRSRIGGGRPSIRQGLYVEPTIFYDVDNSARISREEIFGPVASVIPFEGEPDAIRIANDTPYGLAAAVWTRDIYKAFRVVKSLRPECLGQSHAATYVEAPWGGYKQSGFWPRTGPWGSKSISKPNSVRQSRRNTIAGT